MGVGTQTGGVRRGSTGRQVVTLLLLLAFAFQSYVTQTHIHEIFAPASQRCDVTCVVHAPSHDSSPFGEAADCPLCQAIVHAGTFFAPAVVALFVPRLWVETTLPAVKTVVTAGVPARDGLSRAPPR
ncbi:MAG: hypothetical protein ACTHLR_09430 [Rhizomicrobium sp.]